MNKQGNFLIGILFVAFGIIILMGIAPTLESMTAKTKGCGYFNCAGYTDPDATSGSVCDSTNRTYSNTYDTNDFGCLIVPLTIPLLMLGVVIAGIIMVLYGRREEQSPYAGAGYPGY